MQKIGEGREIEISYEEMEEYYVNLRRIDVSKKDKLTLCATSLEKTLSKKRKSYLKEVEIINLDLCSTDKETGDITLTDKGDMCFTPANLKKQKLKIEELQKKTIKITVMKTPDLRRVKTISNPSLCIMFDGVLWDLPENFWDEGNEEDKNVEKSEEKKEEITQA